MTTDDRCFAPDEHWCGLRRCQWPDTTNSHPKSTYDGMIFCGNFLEMPYLETEGFTFDAEEVFEWRIHHKIRWISAKNTTLSSIAAMKL